MLENTNLILEVVSVRGIYFKLTDIVSSLIGSLFSFSSIISTLSSSTFTKVSFSPLSPTICSTGGNGSSIFFLENARFLAIKLYTS